MTIEFAPNWLLQHLFMFLIFLYLSTFINNIGFASVWMLTAQKNVVSNFSYQKRNTFITIIIVVMSFNSITCSLLISGNILSLSSCSKFLGSRVLLSRGVQWVYRWKLLVNRNNWSYMNLEEEVTKRGNWLTKSGTKLI